MRYSDVQLAFNAKKDNGHSCCQSVTITKGLESALFTHIHNKLDI